MSYVRRATIRRSKFYVEEDPASERLGRFLDSFEGICVYLPADKAEYENAVNELLPNANFPYPNKPTKDVQYLVNSQLSYVARRIAPQRWIVEREVNYGMSSNYRADLRVVANPAEDDEHEPFSIWFETDVPDETNLRRKLGERISVIGQSDAYVGCVYPNSEKKWSRVEPAASLLLDDMERKYRTNGNSLAVLRVDPPDLYRGLPDVVVNAHLLLERSALRVAEFHFMGPDSWVLNEFVTDERGTRYPHRDPPPPQPNPPRLRGLSILLGIKSPD